jgi:2-C-methyl-D-erythritol 2,4-cyclodiphosphate synthase
LTTRSGIGFDVHPLVDGRPLVLGGVAIPYEKGLAGHSDGDVLAHAIVDALLGGAGLGDIGTHFPSADPALAGISGPELIARTVRLLAESGWRATYVDATIMAERPALSPFMARMRRGLSASLDAGGDAINLKATTTDGLGLIGRGEGMAAMAVAILESTK